MLEVSRSRRSAVGAGATERPAPTPSDGLVLAQVAVGDPAALALDDDLDALAGLAAGDEHLLASLDLADLAASSPGVVHRLSGAVVQSLVSAPADGLGGRGQGAVGAGLAHGFLACPGPTACASGPGHHERSRASADARRSWADRLDVGCWRSTASRSRVIGARRARRRRSGGGRQGGEAGRRRLVPWARRRTGGGHRCPACGDGLPQR